jgi:ribosomal protein L18
MKTSIKTFALAFAFVASTFVAQAEDKEAKRAVLGTGIYPTKAGKINVLVDKTNAESSTTLLLKNENGDVVYRETISKEQQKFGRTLNLDNMEAGQYKLDVISGKDIQSKTFQLSDQKVERTVTVK